MGQQKQIQQHQKQKQQEQQKQIQQHQQHNNNNCDKVTGDNNYQQQLLNSIRGHRQDSGPLGNYFQHQILNAFQRSSDSSSINNNNIAAAATATAAAAMTATTTSNNYSTVGNIYPAAFNTSTSTATAANKLVDGHWGGIYNNSNNRQQQQQQNPIAPINNTTFTQSIIPPVIPSTAPFAPLTPLQQREITRQQIEEEAAKAWADVEVGLVESVYDNSNSNSNSNSNTSTNNNQGNGAGQNQQQQHYYY